MVSRANQESFVLIDDNSYSDLGRRLRPLADLLPAPRAGVWLAEHPEPGQTHAPHLGRSPVVDRLHFAQCGTVPPTRA